MIAQPPGGREHLPPLRPVTPPSRRRRTWVQLVLAVAATGIVGTAVAAQVGGEDPSAVADDALSPSAAPS